MTRGEDQALKKQYDLFILEAGKRLGVGHRSMPPIKRRPVNIDEIKANVEKEIAMLDTAANFSTGSQLPHPSYLADYMSPVICTHSHPEETV
ncbi:MAG: hypothetical protein P4M11_03770 [Candidatus Pacebacteria bacterium]|nr:hypothetical protein [Candidatus Paceibacterota bacterium]